MDPFWAACGRGELVIQRCTACGRRVHLPAASCPWCGGGEHGGELVFEPVSGLGTVHTFTVVHRAVAPFAAAWVDLPEGARVFGHVVGCPPDEVRIGMPVRVTFVNDLPHWRPV